MIRINNVEYEELHFEHGKTGNYESLHIKIHGKLCKENKLHIDYEDNSYFGCKLLPKFMNGITDFFVYIYQKGDSELE